MAKNKGLLIGLGCGGALILGLIIVVTMFVGAKNRMVALNEQIDAQWAQVENQLKRRNDLIPNLVSTVKGYAAHEKEIFTGIAEARAKLAGAKTVDDRVKANVQLESALSRLLVVVERYPDLKANQNFIRLMDELSGTENRISVERMRFNEYVKQYNLYIKMIPGSFFASIFGYQPREFFEVPEAEQAVPKVDFGVE